MSHSRFACGHWVGLVSLDTQRTTCVLYWRVFHLYIYLSIFILSWCLLIFYCLPSFFLSFIDHRELQFLNSVCVCVIKLFLLIIINRIQGPSNQLPESLTPTHHYQSFTGVLEDYTRQNTSPFEMLRTTPSQGNTPLPRRSHGCKFGAGFRPSDI